MKTFSDAASAAIDRGDAIVTGAATIFADEPIRVWGGDGTLSIEGEDYRGLGDRGMAQQTAKAIGGTAQGMKLMLSGVDPAVLEALDADEVVGKPVVVERLVFASDGRTLLDHQVFDRGRADQVNTVEEIGGPAAIEVPVESAARGLGGRGQRMRSDADQRLIADAADDGYFRNTAFAGEKMLYWGGKKPARAGGVLTGGGGPAPGGIFNLGYSE